MNLSKSTSSENHMETNIPIKYNNMDTYAFISVALLLMALFLNILNIVVIKYGKSYLNSTDILQMIKAFLIMVTLLTLCPLDIQSIKQPYLKASIFCQFKGVIEDLLFGAFPMTALAIAITRWRVCKCNGNSNILVSRFSSCLTLIACLMFPISSIIGILLFTSYKGTMDSKKMLCGSMGQTQDINLFLLASVVMTKIIPSVCVIVVYAFIYRLVCIHAYNSPQSNQNDGFTSESNARKSVVSTKSMKNPQHIFISLYLIVCIYVVTMLPYLCLSIFSNVQSPTYKPQLNAWMVISKIFVCLLHPVGEGIIQEEKRKRLASFFKKITKTYCKRSSAVDAIRDDPIDDVSLTNNRATMNEYILPTLFEDMPLDAGDKSAQNRNFDITAQKLKKFDDNHLSSMFLVTKDDRPVELSENCSFQSNGQTSSTFGMDSEKHLHSSGFMKRPSIQTRKSSTHRSMSSPDLKASLGNVQHKKLVRSNTDRSQMNETLKEMGNMELKMKPADIQKCLRVQVTKNTHYRQMQDSLALPFIGMRPLSQSSQSTHSRPSSTSSRFLSGAGSGSGWFSNSSKLYSYDSHASDICSFSNDTMSNSSLKHSLTLSGRHTHSSICSRVPSLISTTSRNSDFLSRQTSLMGFDMQENNDCEMDTLSMVSKHF